jgi:hypothetical protein
MSYFATSWLVIHHVDLKDYHPGEKGRCSVDNATDEEDVEEDTETRTGPSPVYHLTKNSIRAARLRWFPAVNTRCKESERSTAGGRGMYER